MARRFAYAPPGHSTRRKVAKLSQKQLRALSRALKRKGRKLPDRGHCTYVTKVGGAYDTRTVASSSRTVIEVCHDRIGGKSVYSARSKPRSE